MSQSSKAKLYLTASSTSDWSIDPSPHEKEESNAVKPESDSLLKSSGSGSELKMQSPNPAGASSSDPESNGLISHLDSASDPLTRQSKEEVSDDEDDDMFMVPEMTQNNPKDAGGPPEKLGRSRNTTADREHKKIKRLLRNRVSAQQARERKKVYVSDMELRARELQESNSRLEEKISTLINENTMLRKVLISSRPKNENTESKP